MKKIGIIAILYFWVMVGSGPLYAMEINYDVSSKAKIIKLNVKQEDLIKKSSEKMVVFEVTIQNTDSEANLYSVMVMIAGVGGAEDFIPVKGDKKLEPNAKATTSIGIASGKFPPDAVTIKIASAESR